MPTGLSNQSSQWLTRIVCHNKEQVCLDDPENSVSKHSNAEYLCSVCFATEPNSVFMPCGHGSICNQCALGIFEKSDECPFCRKVVEDSAAHHAGAGDQRQILEEPEESHGCLGSGEPGRTRRRRTAIAKRSSCEAAGESRSDSDCPLPKRRSV